MDVTMSAMDIALSSAGILLLGGAIGIISNALGLGGGFIMLPALMFFVPNIGFTTAKGTDLMCIAFIAAINAWRMNKGQANKNLRLAGIMACGSTLGAVAATRISLRMPEDSLVWIFVTIMAVLALRTIFSTPRHVTEETVHKHNMLAFFIGLSAGVLSGFTALGGGAVMVPLALLAGLVTNDRVVALSNMVMVATTSAATITNLASEQTFYGLPGTVGQVNLLIVPLVVIGAQFGAPLGRRLNANLTLVRRKVIMGGLILVIACYMSYDALTNDPSDDAFITEEVVSIEGVATP
jgi:uncharacterized membrane protein YfcA